jgi:protein-L-isoaspartate(D-aspartate) O-methyltransferase
MNEPRNSEADRLLMVSRQLKARGINNERVLAAFAKVPRDQFVAPDLQEHAYEDRPLSIGCSQTISQPFIVAYMLQAADVRPEDHVLELGTGSGYQTALLADLAKTVVSLERHPELAETARERLSRLGYSNVEVIAADGTLGYPELAPYDVVMVSAAAPHVPPALVDQLAEHGRLVIPVGVRQSQNLVLVRKTPAGIQTSRLEGCAFVPLIGAEGFQA